MKYYVFTKTYTGEKRTGYYDSIFTNNLETFENFEYANFTYKHYVKTKQDKEVVFLIADFGIARNVNLKEDILVDSDKMYFPFFVIACSDVNYFNYERYKMRNVRVILDSDGIKETFFDNEAAFTKFQYYVDNRIGATLCISYDEKCTVIVPITNTKSILWMRNIDYIKRFALEEYPQDHIFKLGPFEIRKRVGV